MAWAEPQAFVMSTQTSVAAPRLWSVTIADVLAGWLVSGYLPMYHWNVSGCPEPVPIVSVALPSGATVVSAGGVMMIGAQSEADETMRCSSGAEVLTLKPRPPR